MSAGADQYLAFGVIVDALTVAAIGITRSDADVLDEYLQAGR
jgi:hypothetical protein